jgi:hypothetical protein
MDFTRQHYRDQLAWMLEVVVMVDQLNNKKEFQLKKRICFLFKRLGDVGRC